MCIRDSPATYVNAPVAGSSTSTVPKLGEPTTSNVNTPPEDATTGNVPCTVPPATTLTEPAPATGATGTGTACTVTLIVAAADHNPPSATRNVTESDPAVDPATYVNAPVAGSSTSTVPK